MEGALGRVGEEQQVGGQWVAVACLKFFFLACVLWRGGGGGTRMLGILLGIGTIPDHILKPGVKFRGKRCQNQICASEISSWEGTCRL